MDYRLLWCIFSLVASAMSLNTEAQLKAANDQFTVNMFQELIKIKKDENCLLSAFSVLSPLTQLGLAAVGETHDEIFKAIGFSNDNIAKESFADLWLLPTIEGVVLQQANKIYIRNNFTLNVEFASTTKDSFNSEIQNIDFEQKENAANEINTWVEGHTNKRIKNLIQANSITDSTAAILINAVYFKGKWRSSFSKRSTHSHPFDVSHNKKITVQMMRQQGTFEYTESQELDAKFLELEYKGGEASFIVVLPNKIDGVHELIKKIKDPAVLNKAIKSMATAAVLVQIPKFRIETTTDIKEILAKMNIIRLFRSGAELVKLLKESKDLYISSAIQKTFIEVNEDGTEAAAATEMDDSFGAAMLTDVKNFEASHPFIFFVMVKENILFTGVFQS